MPSKADDIQTDEIETVWMDVSSEERALLEAEAERVALDAARTGERIDVAAEPLDAVLNVRFPSREKTAFCEMASQAGLTASALARRRCMGRPATLHAEDALIDRLRRAGLIALREKAGRDEAGGRAMDAILRELRAALHRLNRPLDGRTNAKRP
jgi:hypothetical protein